MKRLLLCLVMVIVFVPSAFGGAVSDLLGEMITALSSCKTASQATTIASRIMTSDRIKLAINSGEDINAKGEYGVTLLMLATGASNNPEIVRLLLEAGADVNAKDDEGFTALIVALAPKGMNNPEIVRLLIDAGADMNARDNNGMAAPDYALENPNPEIRKIFTDILRKD
ncbi:MAG: ankyrin repeat domain-containing protein [Synergistaceae bacterium]|nr:ankyrin repeat domain-containing protein [Synergistaceae bacterium]